MEKVSIIVPTYKRSLYLERAIKSILNQTYQNIEVIVVDDNEINSKFRVETESIMQKYSKNIKVKYIKNKRNIGGALSRNVGIQHSSGEFIAFLDDDDEYLPEKIEKQYDFYKKKFKEKKNGFIYCQAKYIDGKGREIFNFERTPEGNEEVIFELLKTGFTSTGCLFFPKKLLIEVNGFEKMKCGQEWYVILKILLNKYLCYGQKEKLLIYNDHLNERITNGKNKIEGEKELYQIKQIHINQMDILKKQELNYYNNIRLAKLCLKFKNKEAVKYIIEANKIKKIPFNEKCKLIINYLFSDNLIKKIKVYKFKIK